MPPPRKEYEDTLRKLATLLKRKPMTAREISAAFRCSKPTAYERLDALRERGTVIYEVKSPQAHTGPKAIAYGIR